MWSLVFSSLKFWNCKFEILLVEILSVTQKVNKAIPGIKEVFCLQENNLACSCRQGDKGLQWRNVKQKI